MKKKIRLLLLVLTGTAATAFASPAEKAAVMSASLHQTALTAQLPDPANLPDNLPIKGGATCLQRTAALTFPDPSAPLRAETESSYTLTVQSDGSDLPDSFRQYESDSFTAPLKNSGPADFDGNVAFALLSQHSDEIAYLQYYQPLTLAAGQTASIAFPYDMSDIMPGTYRMCICDIGFDDTGSALSYISPIDMASGSPYKTVEVIGAEKPNITYPAAEIEFPGSAMGITSYNKAFLWSQSYTLTASLTNSGGEFTGDLYAVLCRPNADNTALDLYHISDAVSLTIGKGERKEVQFAGEISSELPLGVYYFGIMDASFSLLTSEEGTTTRVYVIYPLTILTEGSVLPETINQHENASLTLRLRNTGEAEINDILYMCFENPSNGTLSFMGQNTVSIPAASTADVEIPYNVKDWEAGTATMYFGFRVNGYIYILGMEDGSDSKTVEIVSNEGPELTLETTQSELPKEAVLNNRLTVKAAISNTGADFENDLYIVLYGNDGFVRWRSEPTHATVKRGETATFTLAGTLTDPAILRSRPVAYYMDVAYYDNSGINGIPQNQGSETSILIVHPDPETQPVLTWLDTKTKLPEKFVPGESYTLYIAMQNSGKVDFTGDVELRFSTSPSLLPDPTTTYRLAKNTYYIGKGTEWTDLTFDFLLPTDFPAGEYFMEIGAWLPMPDEAFLFDLIPTEALTLEVPVRVETPASGTDAVQTQFSVRPNPVSSHATVKASEGIRSMRLYSLSGALMVNKDCRGAEEYRLDMEDCPSGVYLLEVEMPNEVRTERIIKK